MYAADPAMAQLLLRAGADPQAVDDEGHDVLMHAAMRDQLGVFRILLAALGSDMARIRALALLRRASNVYFRACRMRIDSMFKDEDGEVLEEFEDCGLPPASLQEACIPFAQASTHTYLQGLEGIRALRLLSDGELAALVTASDESTMHEFF